MTRARLVAPLLAGCILAFAATGAIAQATAPSPAAPEPAKAGSAAADSAKADPGMAAGPAGNAGDAKADAAPPAAVASGPLAPFAWLAGCWRGSVNQREFREVWLPPRGNLMVGAGHNALPDRTVSFELLRLEPRPEGVVYVAAPSGQKEVAFLHAETKRDGPDELFLFSNAANPFPTNIVYRRATGGWLYVEVVGKQKGKDHKVIYPFRRIDCETGEFIRR